MGNDMLEAYLFEMHSLLEQLDDMVLSSEKAGTFSQGDVNEIFRIMHTFKGSSAMMEYNSLMTVAHRIEDLFFIIRENSMDVVSESLRPELFDLIFQAIDFFRGEIEKLESNLPLTDSIDSFMGKINSLYDKISGKEPETEAVEAAQEPEAESQAVSVEGGNELAQLEAEYAVPEFPLGLHIIFDEGCGMENLRAMMLVNAVKDVCDDKFDYYPPDVQLNPDTAPFIVENGFFIRFTSKKDRQKASIAVQGNSAVQEYRNYEYHGAAVVEKPRAADKPKTSATSNLSKKSGAPASAPARQSAPVKSVYEPEEPPRSVTSAPVSVVSAPTPAPDAQSGAGQSAAKQSHAKESLISVSLSKLDALMAVVGEIIITEAQVTASPDLKGLKLDNFNKASRQLRSLTDTLQEVALSLRMVPVSGTFQKQKRIVRDMSKKLGKDAELILEGEDTEVDKTIVDGISDPIMHIVRNSMDHGIEDSQDERIAAGKNPTGKIILSARQTGGEVIIEVEDDGQGVNDEAVLNKALRQGLAQPGMEYSHKEILNFLLMPGFSTNTEVTEFSGRGVGMDVVKSNVESVGGTVTVTSERGKGMTTTLKIPLTTSIMDGMEVSAGDSIFTVPLNDIRQIFRVTESEIIKDSSHGEMIKIMDNFYSVIRVRDFYQLDHGVENWEDGVLLWVGSVDNSFCLFVDALLGEQQIVVKPLPAYVNSFGVKHYGITGCSVLGDGSISLILDVASILDANNQQQ